MSLIHWIVLLVRSWVAVSLAKLHTEYSTGLTDAIALGQLELQVRHLYFTRKSISTKHTVPFSGKMPSSSIPRAWAQVNEIPWRKSYHISWLEHYNIDYSTIQAVYDYRQPVALEVIVKEWKLIPGSDIYLVTVADNMSYMVLDMYMHPKFNPWLSQTRSSLKNKTPLLKVKVLDDKKYKLDIDLMHRIGHYACIVSQRSIHHNNLNITTKMWIDSYALHVYHPHSYWCLYWNHEMHPLFAKSSLMIFGMWCNKHINQVQKLINFGSK